MSNKNPIGQNNSPEHMAKMRSRITSGTHSAENKLQNLVVRIREAKDRLAAMELKADRLRQIIARRNERLHAMRTANGVAKMWRERPGSDLNFDVEEALKLLVTYLAHPNKKNMG